MVRCAVGLPNVGEFADPPVLVDLAVAAEEAGWDGFHLFDHVLYHEPTWPVASPVVVLSAVAAATRRLRLILTCAVPRRRAWVVAREVATLDALSGGRLVFAPVLGSMDLEYSAFGESSSLASRAAVLDESLSFLAGAWRGDAVAWRGGPPVRLLPARPGIPVWGAGRWPARPGLRRAARWQGVLPTFAGYGRAPQPPVPVGLFASAVGYVRAQRGSLDGFDVALEGATEPGGSVRPYADAGLTWWIEAMGWWRGGPAHARTRVAAGPPAA